VVAVVSSPNRARRPPRYGPQRPPVSLPAPRAHIRTSKLLLTHGPSRRLRSVGIVMIAVRSACLDNMNRSKTSLPLRSSAVSPVRSQSMRCDGEHEGEPASAMPESPRPVERVHGVPVHVRGSCCAASLYPRH